MRILLDEDVPHPLTRALQGYDVRTVAEMGWAGVKNGELLKKAVAEQFEVFLTGDKSLPKQQDLSRLPFGVLILSAISWTVIRENVATISRAVDASKPGTVSIVECGAFLPRGKR